MAKNSFFASLLGLIVIAILFEIDKTGICYPGGAMCHLFLDKLGLLWSVVMFLSPPAFFLSLLTFPLNNRIFNAWFNFSVVWVPLTVILFLIPQPSIGGWLGPLPTALDVVVIGMYFFYILISILIILIQSIRVYWLKK